MSVDATRATLRDLVEGILQLELGYSDEISIMNNTGKLIYDPDEEEQLPKKLSEMEIGNQSSLTIVDDDDQNKNPRINLELLVVER